MIDVGWASPAEGGATLEQVVLGYIIKQTEEAMGRGGNAMGSILP